MNAPNLRCRPLFVSGIPTRREILDLNAETPMNLQIEKPPTFIDFSIYQTKIRRALQLLIISPSPMLR
jgi:hypothetical protein